MEALTAQLREELARARARRSGPRAPRRAEEDVRPRPGGRAARSGLSVSRAVAARGPWHVRRGGAGGRARHGRRPRLGPGSRHHRERRHGQGRHVLSGDGQEAPARPGDRRREPVALRLPGRLRRRVSSAAGGRVPGSGALRPHLLQPGADVVEADRPDRGRHGLLHRRRRLRAGDVGRGGHRQGHGNDLSGRAAAGQGRDGRGRHGRGSGRRRRAHPDLGRRGLSGRGRRARPRDRAHDRRDDPPLRPQPQAAPGRRRGARGAGLRSPGRSTGSSRAISERPTTSAK